MAEVVYILCAILSFSCALFLMRAYRKNKFNLLFWSGIGFAGFTLNNVLLFFDYRLGTDYDLSIYRLIAAVLGMLVMIWGLITEMI